MTVEALLGWACTVAALTYAVSRSVYGFPLRVLCHRLACGQAVLARVLGSLLLSLIYCGICTGFWVGAVLALAFDWSPLYASHQADVGRAFLSGCGGSVVAGLWFRLAGLEGIELIDKERKLCCGEGGADA